MPYWRLHYHLAWCTFERHRLITPAREILIQQTLYAKARELGLTLHAVGGTEDHIHVVASIPPALSVSDCVKHLKGASARAVNTRETQQTFRWQGGYGALTIGGRSLANVIEYVANQKQHHGEGTQLAIYERTTEADDSSPQSS